MSMTMMCPSCGSSKTSVKDSRASNVLMGSIRRRRQCTCGARFTTFETSEEAIEASIQARVQPMLRKAMQQLALNMLENFGTLGEPLPKPATRREIANGRTIQHLGSINGE